VDESVVEELRERLHRLPEDRYPVQHATARFHLGMALARLGRLEEAEEALAAAARLFDGRLAAEHATAMNALGAVLRDSGRPEQAGRAFRRAEAVFERAGATTERGAAIFNQGLALRDLGDEAGAAERFREARLLLDPAMVPAQAAAAARELGASLLRSGSPEEAIESLEESMLLADGGRDPAGFGAAANALGLAHLAAGRTGRAVEAFRTSVGSHPRSVRPAEHAMAKANLGLALERDGDHSRARLAALQALRTPHAPEPVRIQAFELLERLPGGPGEVLRVLDREPPDRWAAIVREEAIRWADEPEEDREAEAGAWVEGQLARPDRAGDLAEALLAALLEMPPEGMERIIRSIVTALSAFGGEDRTRFREETSSAMARFHVPQLLRLKDTFERLGRELGPEDPWT
jgi:tetratricopeptide (TPR) repeat protein